MFAKLLKHEWKSTGGMLGIFSACMLGLGLLGGLLMRFAMNSAGTGNDTEMILILSIVALPLYYVALIAYSLGGQIYLAIQFYKSKFTDRGYLSFTLPVRPWQIYLSSLLNMVTWTVIISAVVVATVALTLTVGMYSTDIWREIAEILEMIGKEDLYVFGYSVWTLVELHVGFISSNVILITGITLGCVVAQKHKVLAAIGFYFAINTVIGIISAVIGVAALLSSAGGNMNPIYMITALLQMAVSVGGTVVSIWLMNKKLNLP